MNPLLYLFSHKYRLFSALIFSFLLPTASLIFPPVVKAELSSQILPLDQGDTKADTQEENLLEKRAKDFIDLLVEEKYQQTIDYLAPEIKAEVDANQNKRLWEELNQRYGKFKNISHIKYTDALNVKVINVEVNFEKYPRTITLVFNAKDQIIGINIPQDQKDDTIEQIANKFVDSLTTGDYLAATFNLHPYLKAEFPPGTIKQRWENIDKRYGGFKKRLNTESEPGNSTKQADIAIVTIEFNDTIKNMLLIFNSEKQIIGVDFENIFEK
jgi:hypothetical protein